MMLAKTMRGVNNWVIKTKTIAWILMLAVFLVFAIQVTVWAIDRKPPITYNASTFVPPIIPGMPAKIIWTVDRHRFCSVNIKRLIQDSTGARYYQYAIDITASQIRDLYDVSPHEVSVLIDIPQNIALGKALYITESEYYCNPLHKIWPIKVVADAPLVIEAPKITFLH